jgi:hypothetical protein
MKPTVSILGAKLALAILVPAFAASSAAQSSEDFANKQGARRVVLVSIEDRRLAVLENGKVLAYFSVAVGADVSRLITTTVS